MKADLRVKASLALAVVLMASVLTTARSEPASAANVSDPNFV